MADRLRAGALIPPTDPGYASLVARGFIQTPVYTDLPSTWEGSGLVARKAGTQAAPTFDYYVWDGNSWNLVAAATGGTHNILDGGGQHIDAGLASVARGALIVGQLATPVWGRLSLGASGQVLRSNGTDALWATLALTDISPRAHSSLTDLIAPADDHTQYFLLTGRAVSQVANGSTLTAGTLDLRANAVDSTGRFLLRPDLSSILFLQLSGINQSALVVDATTASSGGGRIIDLAGNITLNSNDRIVTGVEGSWQVINTGRTGTIVYGFNFGGAVNGGTFVEVAATRAVLSTGSSGAIITAAYGHRILVSGAPTGWSIGVGSGTVTGLEVGNVGHANFATVTAIDILSQTAGGTSTFNIRQRGTTGINRLAAQTLIGDDASTPAASVVLTLVGATALRFATAAANIQSSTGVNHITFSSATLLTLGGASGALGGVRINDNMGINVAPTATGARLALTGFMSASAVTQNIIAVNFGTNLTANATNRRGFNFAGAFSTDGFNLTNLIGVNSAPPITVGDDVTPSTITLFACYQAQINAASASGTALHDVLTDVFSYNAIAPSFGAAAFATLGRVAGLHIANHGGIFVTGTSYAIDIEAQSGSTTNRTIRALGTAPSIHEPALMVGANAAPAATLHVQQPTLGNEVQRLESIATNDDPSERVFQNRVATTDATVTTLHTVTIPASTTVQIIAYVQARRTGGTLGTAEDGAGYVVVATVKNVAGTATHITGSPVLNITHEDQVLWDATIDVTGATARVRVTGAASNNVTWHCTVRVLQVGS